MLPPVMDDEQLKVVIVSDTHGRHRRVEVPDGDLLIHAGDFTAGGRWSDVDEIDDWLGGFSHDQKIVVAGNCDGCCEGAADEVRSRLTHATYLMDEAVEFRGLTIWGSPWQPEFMNLAFNLPRGEALAERWAQMPDSVDILVTHGPPAGILDRTSRGERVGDEALRRRADEVSPKLHAFGHVHESSGREDSGDTTFINAACNSASDVPAVVYMEMPAD
jgi:Icc-related predicted phosphoesterase